jgi:muramoyltetrapeptide carboxypeptidase
MMKSWKPLKKNDKVRIVAPGAGSPITGKPNSNWPDLEKCCELLQSWELTPVYSPLIFGEHHSYYNFANVCDKRSEDFLDALSSDAAAIWPFRGGYGSDRVLQSILKNNIKAPQTKLVVGFSDITVIHNFILSHWQWSSLHALSMRQLGLGLVNETDIAETRAIIFGEKTELSFTLFPLNAAARDSRKIQGCITGGNLTMVQTAIGTPWTTPINNSILLLEDVGEQPYRIARIFQQFLASNYLASVQAIILGDFFPTKSIDLVLHEFADACSIPVLHCEGIGHGPRNRPVPLGTQTVLTLGENPLLVAE